MKPTTHLPDTKYILSNPLAATVKACRPLSGAEEQVYEAEQAPAGGVETDGTKMDAKMDTKMGTMVDACVGLLEYCFSVILVGR